MQISVTLMDCPVPQSLVPFGHSLFSPIYQSVLITYRSGGYPGHARPMLPSLIYEGEKTSGRQWLALAASTEEQAPGYVDLTLKESCSCLPGNPSAHPWLVYAALLLTSPLSFPAVSGLGAFQCPGCPER